MKIALTGGSGAMGRVLVEYLVSAGHDVLSLDLVECGSLPCPEQALSLNDYGATFAALRGRDAIVHFGANPYPDENHEAAADRFANNTVSTFNVFNAALAHGIKRIVWASSETVFGYPFKHNAPRQIPVREDMLAPQTAYAMSKIACEDIARMLCDIHTDAKIIGLRLSNVLYAEALDGIGSEGKQPINRKRDTYKRLPTYWDDVTARDFNLWGYIDARDVCSAVDCALRADIKGAHSCAIVADDTLMDRPTRTLVEERFPGALVADDHPEFGGAVSNQFAKELLGWSPAWSWRDMSEVKLDDRDEAA